MSCWSVEPGQVSRGGCAVRAVGDEVGAMPGSLVATIRAIGAAAGSPGVAEAAASASSRWGGAILALGTATAALGRSAAGAAASYGAVETTVTDAFGAGAP